MDVEASTLAATAAAALGAACLVRGPCAAAGPQLEPAQKQAAIAAVVGNLVADAAAVTSHWVYDQQSLKQQVADAGGEQHAPFIEPIKCGPAPSSRCPPFPAPTDPRSP